jgi:Transposase DDE domain
VNSEGHAAAFRGGRGRRGRHRRPDSDDRDGASSGRPAWYGDSAYGTGELRQAIATAGHQAVIKPWPLQPAVEGGFTADHFTVDAAAGTVTCPAGVTRQVTAKNAVIFAVACRDCPLRERCTTSKHSRTLHLHEHHSLLRAARADWAARPELREDYMAHRPHVERAIAQVATWRGRRHKLRYRGTAKNNAWLKRRTAAISLRNPLSHGLARRDSTWVLAT